MYQYPSEATDTQYTGNPWGNSSSSSSSSGLYGGLALPEIPGSSKWPGIGGWMQAVERLSYLSHHDKSAGNSAQIAEIRQQMHRRLEEQQTVLQQLGRWIQDASGQLSMLATLLQTMTPDSAMDNCGYAGVHKHNASTASTTESSATAHMERTDEINGLADLLAADPLDYTIGLRAWQQALRRNQQAQVQQQRQPFRFNPQQQPATGGSVAADTLRSSRHPTTIALRAPCTGPQERLQASTATDIPCADTSGRRGAALSIRGIMKPHHSHSATSSVRRRPRNRILRSTSSSSSACSTFLCDAEELTSVTRDVSDPSQSAAATAAAELADACPASAHMTLPKAPSSSATCSVADAASPPVNSTIPVTPSAPGTSSAPAIPQAPAIPPAPATAPVSNIPPAPPIPLDFAIPPAPAIPEDLASPTTPAIPPAPPIPPAPAIPPAPSLPETPPAPPLHTSLAPNPESTQPIQPASGLSSSIGCAATSNSAAALHCGSKQQHRGSSAAAEKSGASGGRPKLGIARATCPACAGLSKRTAVASHDPAAAPATDGNAAKSVLELARMFDMRGI
ncbi:hypothetical protein H4R20_000468 [Coemansia guatemalensis]|uniref:Uncharacterized protein n=1 Tax=Coemansia guatemalensis TaxID=2761395 RepID=A0A9W8I1D6_9FUNG|nr:hypothetical protein H4R20_000468 [Coemansia guatemalensis]